jgi:adenine phosphoribosyltransferase
MSLQEVFKKIRVVEDFPKKGINFRHIGPLLEDAELFTYAIKQLYSLSTDHYDVICGLDARGFIIATMLQAITGLPQVMIRKGSKLPGHKYTCEYKKEYGSDIFELEVGSIKPGKRVLIVDDLMATAGTLFAASDLIRQAGGIVAGVMVLIEFRDLGGQERLRPITNVYSLFSLDSFDKSEVLNKDICTPSLLQIKKFRPTVYPKDDNLPVIMWHPTMESFAKKMLQVSNFRPSYVNWNYFPDGWPNITFEPSITMVNKDIVFIMNIAIKEIFLEQLVLLLVLPRQLINSLTIVVPYLGPATHERVDYSGQLATVEPVLKILSSCIPMTKTGPPILRIFDIHALQIRFYINDNTTMKLMSAIPVLLNYLASKEERYIIAYPDDGAYKRFRYFFDDFPQIICSKIRDGDTRNITIGNLPTIDLKNVIIIDDLVQSGETLLSCAKSLKLRGFETISAYVTHAVFPKNAWKKFADSDVINEFIITNTNPGVSDKLAGIKPFVVLDVQTHLCSELRINNREVIVTDPKPMTNIYVATTNQKKLNAVYEASIKENTIFPREHTYEIYSVDGISSGIAEQPWTVEETTIGSLNRFLNCVYLIGKDTTKSSIFVSIENGLFQNANSYADIPVIQYSIFNEEPSSIVGFSKAVNIPDKYFEFVQDSLKSPCRSVTFGSIIEKNLAIKDWHKYISGKSRKDILFSCFVNEDIKEDTKEDVQDDVVPKPKSKPLSVITEKFTRFGAFIDGKINEV